ncbi:hypothetical protein MBLNU13_g07382t2 [Cladosporium sp. NU13]
MEVTPVEAALDQASKAEDAGENARQWCGELSLYGQGEDRNWGFHIYRTVYTHGSDEDFATGMKILYARLREACFSDAEGDDTPNKMIWEKMKNKVIEDRAHFDGVPPAVIQKHFQRWIESEGYHLPNAKSPDPALEMAYSSAHRFCIIIDSEALQNLLRFAPSRTPQVSYDDRICVKLLDVECHEDSLEYEPPFEEGWLWAAPWNLVTVWFDYPTYATQEMRQTDGLGRPNDTADGSIPPLDGPEGIVQGALAALSVVNKARLEHPLFNKVEFDQTPGVIESAPPLEY